MNELNQRILSGNSVKVLPELIKRGEQGTYDLCITSPPYWKLVEYHAGKGDLSMIRDEAEFQKELTSIFTSIRRLLNNQGTLISQWEDLTVARPDGIIGEYMLSSINQAAEDAGLSLFARWIWKKFTKKPTYMPSSFDMASSRLARPNPNWSYAFVYKIKGELRMSAKRTEVTREEWSQYADGVWDFANPGVEIHDTPFARELVDRFLKIYTSPGDRVIDPFLGSGTTMMECINMSRSCTGIELDKKYLDGVKKRIEWGRQSIEYKINYKYEDLSNL